MQRSGPWFGHILVLCGVDTIKLLVVIGVFNKVTYARSVDLSKGNQTYKMPHRVNLSRLGNVFGRL